MITLEIVLIFTFYKNTLKAITNWEKETEKIKMDNDKRLARME